MHVRGSVKMATIRFMSLYRYIGRSSSHLAAQHIPNLSNNTDTTREFYGSLRQVKTSPQKMNLVAKLIRGMSIADALVQMEFCEKKPAQFIKATLLDTQRRAIETYNVKPTNLFIAESFVGKGTYLKRIRYHGRGQAGLMHKYYAHYFLKLKEGPPPPKKKRALEDQKIYKTKKLINRGPLTIPNSL